MAKENKSAYAQAGVNIDVKMGAVSSIKAMVAATKTANVLGGIGAFGGLHKVPTGKDMILVASTDGVGTKLKVAAMMNKHDTVGQDIVIHCVNDILVQGALPLFFMDYIGTSKVDPAVFKSVAKLPTEKITGGVLLNQKMTPQVLAKEENKQKLEMLIATFFDTLKGYHVQYNIVSRETLIDAQKHPEKHKDLIVRVAGYSAFFNVLSKATQDDIIGRTEQSL